MDFKYKAIDQKNNLIEGTEAAKNKFELANFLKTQGLILIDAEETKIKKVFDFKKLLQISTISMREKISFARNIGAMIEAGLSLSRALSVMEKQSPNKKMKRVVKEISNNIKKGDSFSTAISNFPKIFDNLFVSMVRAGEESGNVVESLKEIASQMEKTYLLKKKIKGAMIYPGVIITAMIGIGIFMMVYIVPTLTSTFEDIGSELPASTRFIIGISDFFNNNIVTAIVLVLLFSIAIYLIYKSKRGKQVLDFLLLHFPMISVLVKETNSARTTRTLASLLKSGVPYIQAVKITKATISNSFYIKVMEKVEKQVEMGLQVSKVFEENVKLYPAFVAEMIAVGEETGELSPMLLKVAEFYENEVEQKTKNISTIVEPILMIFVGAAVGFFAVSMISPMYSLVNEF
jgi:type IV pilus assembly protein PilC